MSAFTPPELLSKGTPNLKKARSRASGLAYAAGLMMATVMLSRILGLLRDAIIAHFFGQGRLTDAYNAAFTVPDLLFYLLQSGALSSTIVPIITEYSQEGKEDLADKTVSIVATTIFVVIGLAICVMEIKTRALTIALNPGFLHRIDGEETIRQSVRLTRILLPAQMCFFLGGLMMGVLYAHRKFLVPALGPVIYNSGIIFGGLVLRRWLGIEGLVWGAIGGAILGNLLIPYLAVRKIGLHYTPSLSVFSPAARKVWRMLLPMGLGVALPNIDQIVNKLFASYLGAGALTATMNGYRLMLLPIGVFAQAMSLAVFPTLSTQVAENEMVGMRRTMSQSLRSILFLTLPSSALMYLLAPQIIGFILQSGKFNHADTLVTASALRFFSLGICSWSTQSLLTRGFYALQSPRVPVASGAIVSVLFVGMNWSVVHYTNWGVMGLAAATTTAATIHAVALFFLLRRRLSGLHGGETVISILRMSVATAGMCATAFLVRNIVSQTLPIHETKIHSLIVLTVAAMIGLAVFAGIAFVLKMPELRWAVGMVRRKRPLA